MGIDAHRRDRLPRDGRAAVMRSRRQAEIYEIKRVL